MNHKENFIKSFTYKKLWLINNFGKFPKIYIIIIPEKSTEKSAEKF